MKIVGAREMFDMANNAFVLGCKNPVFQVQFIGCAPRHDFVSGYLSIKPEHAFAEIEKTDLIIIPALDEDFSEIIQQNKELIEWLKKQYKHGAEIASLCTGAFLLAATGLLDRKKCMTHWWAADRFRKMFPEATLVTDKIITDESGIYTSGGAFSSFNLLLHIIEKYYDRETAISCAKGLELDIDRKSQSPFIIFAGQKDHHDAEVRKSQEFIETNITEKITIDELADAAATSKRNFERRFKRATSNTPTEYIQRVKVEAAKKDLEFSRKNINEVTYDVGYSDTKAFRKIFKKYVGLSPIEYRIKYNKEASTGVW
jgi:transcriptional regulator GlxA family with amidase domain